MQIRRKNLTIYLGQRHSPISLDVKIRQRFKTHLTGKKWMCQYFGNLVDTFAIQGKSNLGLKAGKI